MHGKKSTRRLIDNKRPINIRHGLIFQMVMATGLLLLTPLLSAASYDCKKAQSSVEELICKDSELSRLDDELNIIYQEAQKTVFDQKQLGKQNANELKWRKKNCNDKTCLLQWYAGRKKQLQKLTEKEHPDVSMVSDTTTVSPAANTYTDEELFRYTIYMVGGFALFVFFILLIGLLRRCPNCHKWYARRTELREVLDKYEKTEKRIYRDTVKDSKGKVLRTRTREVPVRVRVEECRYHYRCTYCGHNWEKNKTEKFE